MKGIHILGSAVITVGCGVFGMIKARELRCAVCEITDVMHAVRIIRAELALHMTPIYDLCEIVSQRIGGEIGCLFETCSAYTSDRPFSEQWYEAVSVCRLTAGKRLQEELSHLGDFFGRYDAEEQLASFDLMYSRLSHLQSEAEARYEKNGKLYRSVGISVGLMLGILFL